MKRLLEIENDIDFSLLGISCHAKDYRLSWEINRILSIALEKSDSIINHDAQDESRFATSMFFDKESHIEYCLISNKNEYGYLISEYPQLDYFMRLSGPQHDFEVEQCKNILTAINTILTIIKINPEELKSKLNLVF